jgi:hypothetical protein
MAASKVGSLKCKVEQIDSSTHDIKLKEFKYAPEYWLIPFNINKALKRGSKISKKRINLSFKFNSVQFYLTK